VSASAALLFVIVILFKCRCKGKKICCVRKQFSVLMLFSWLFIDVNQQAQVNKNTIKG